MRGTAKILMLLAVTGALWLALHASSFPIGDTPRALAAGKAAPAAGAGSRASSEASESAPTSDSGSRGEPRTVRPPSSEAASGDPPRALRDRPDLLGGAAPIAAPEPADRDLDDASEPVIREALGRAVERARDSRSLFVSPAVIETAATERRVGIVFEVAETSPPAATSEEAMATLLSGRSAEARWEALRLFPLLDHGAVRVGPQALLHLIEAEGIRHIELDAVHRPSLAESVRRIGADRAHAAGAAGAGTAIAILDTGIDPSHPMLSDRILDEACFSLTRDCPNGRREMFGPGAGVACAYGCSHGTQVAGIAVGNDPDGGLVGVAPQASLISIQVFSNVQGAPGAYSSDILAGLQHVLSLTDFYDVAVVNLSFGGTLHDSEEACDQAAASQRSAIERLREAGVLTVAAAGNEYTPDALASPACLSNAISVGSSSSADSVSPFSNSASFLSILAPGESIESARKGGGTLVTTGTSMATPHVAGALAVLRGIAPAASVTELENVLALTGVPVLDPRNGFTTPRVDVEAARALLSSMAESTSAPVASGAATPDSAGSAGGSSSGGGGSSCGLIGIEPFLLAGILRLVHRRPGRCRTRGRIAG